MSGSYAGRRRMNPDKIADHLASGSQMPLARALVERHSCRAFRQELVERPILEAIFSMAQGAASWCNAQPWQATIASGNAVERLRAALLRAVDEGAEVNRDLPFPKDYRGVYLDRRRECGFQLYESVGVSRGDKAGYARQARENFRFFGAPQVAALTTDADLGVYGAVDVGGYVQVLLLAMQAHGIATIAQAAPANYSDVVKSALGIDPERRLVCCVAFGYEDAEGPANRFRTRRAALSDVVAWIDD